MRALVPVLLLVSTIGCSSSSETAESNNPLVGKWLSNCYEFLNTEDEAGNNRYVISEITFSESEYVDNFTSYTDNNCTNDPIVEMSAFTYTIGEMITTTDGVKATRISLTAVLPDRPELNATIEGIYRVSGVELNFGEYVEGEIPSIDVGVTYTKQ